MQTFIHQANIAQFRRQIAEEPRPVEREVLKRLLAEEEAKLAALGDCLAAPGEDAVADGGRTAGDRPRRRRLAVLPGSS